MIFLYNCFAGTHSSSVASAVHLKKLPTDRVPTKDEILNVDYFNKLTSKDRGRIIFRGVDEEGNKVFTFGRGASKVLVPCLRNLIELLHQECGISEKIVMSNMSPSVPFTMKVGGCFSRGLGIDFIGVPFLIMGVKQSYMKLVQMVESTKSSAKSTEGRIIVLNNEKYR